MVNCIEQLDRCMNILIPKEEDIFANIDFNGNKTSKMIVSSNNSESELPKAKDKNTHDEVDDDDDSDEDFVEVPLNNQDEEVDIEMRYLGFLNDKSSEFTRNYNLRIDLNLKENDENRVVVDIMRDLYKELKNSHLIKINTWIKVFHFVFNF
jgi:hypothetical protein